MLGNVWILQEWAWYFVALYARRQYRTFSQISVSLVHYCEKLMGVVVFAKVQQGQVQGQPLGIDTK